MRIYLPPYFLLICTRDVKELCAACVCSFAQLCPTLCDPMDCNPLSMELSRQEYWRGCHFVLQGIFLTQGSNLSLLDLLH